MSELQPHEDDDDEEEEEAKGWRRRRRRRVVAFSFLFRQPSLSGLKGEGVKMDGREEREPPSFPLLLRRRQFDLICFRHTFDCL